MFELLFKLIKSIFARKDDPEINKKEKNKQPPPKTQNEKPQKEKKKKKENKQEKDGKEEDKQETVEEENEEDENILYLPFGISRKKYKEQQKKQKKKRKEDKKNYKKLTEPLVLISIIVLLSVNVIPSLFTNAFGKEITVNATIVPSEANPGTYEIKYDFEQEIDNLYGDTMPGDKIKLSDLLWQENCDSKIKIIYIDRDNGFFITSFPHKISNFSLVYSKYAKLKRPKRVQLTIKVTSFYQQITNIEYLI